MKGFRKCIFAARAVSQRRRVYMEAKSLNRSEKTVCLKTFSVLGLPTIPQRKRMPATTFSHFGYCRIPASAFASLLASHTGSPPLIRLAFRLPPGGKEGEIEDVSPRLTYIALLHPSGQSQVVVVAAAAVPSLPSPLCKWELNGRRAVLRKRGGRARLLLQFAWGRDLPNDYANHIFHLLKQLIPKSLFYEQYEAEYFGSKDFSIFYWWYWQRLPPKVPPPPFPSLFMTFRPISPLSTSSSSLDPFSIRFRARSLSSLVRLKGSFSDPPFLFPLQSADMYFRFGHFSDCNSISDFSLSSLLEFPPRRGGHKQDKDSPILLNHIFKKIF